MSVGKALETIVKEANKEWKRDESLQRTLKPYFKRRILLNIRRDRKYSIDITSEGLTLRTMRRQFPRSDDMYLEMERATLMKLISLRKLRLSDLRTIKHRNVTARELNLCRKLMKRHLVKVP